MQLSQQEYNIRVLANLLNPLFGCNGGVVVMPQNNKLIRGFVRYAANLGYNVKVSKTSSGRLKTLQLKSTECNNF